MTLFIIHYTEKSTGKDMHVGCDTVTNLISVLQECEEKGNTIIFVKTVHEDISETVLEDVFLDKKM